MVVVNMSSLPCCGMVIMKKGKGIDLLAHDAANIKKNANIQKL